MSKLRFKVVEEAFDRKAMPVDIPAARPVGVLRKVCVQSSEDV